MKNDTSIVQGSVDGACDSSCDGERVFSAAPADTLSGVSRRTFIVQSAILAAGAALAACAASDSTTAPAIPTSGSSNVVNVSSYPTLANVGGIAMVNIGGAQLAIVRTGALSFMALSRICPHQGGTVQQSGSGFQCPVHGAQFSSSGTWVGGQRTSNLHAYITTYDATAGTLTIT